MRDKTEEYLQIPKFNQRVWSLDPERAREAAIDAIRKGGFGTDCLDRRVGNYEGQIMAIEREWVNWDEYRYVINEKGLEALREAGVILHFLPGKDTWHGCNFEYCVYESKDRNGNPMLTLFSEAIGKAGQLGMYPKLDINDVAALRNFLNSWLERSQENGQILG